MANPQRMTVMLIPPAGKRPISFLFSPTWLLLAGGFAVALLIMLTVLYQHNTILQSRLTEMEELKRINVRQQTELDTMTLRTQETQQRLHLLQSLEEQITDLLGQSPLKPSRGSQTGTDQSALGRGGPKTDGEAAQRLPVFSALLPKEVTGHLFAHRDTLPVRLKELPAYKRSPEVIQSQALATLLLLDEQAGVMDNLLDTLDTSKSALVEHIDFLAHRPSGIPVANARITDRFGWRWNPFGWGEQSHNGIDLAQDYWAPIAATGTGTVIHAGWKAGGYGYAIIIDHGYGYQTLYAHMIDWDVTVGDEVVRGEIIGYVGSTGNSTGPHLHYEVQFNGVATDPTKYF